MFKISNAWKKVKSKITIEHSEANKIGMAISVFVCCVLMVVVNVLLVQDINKNNLTSTSRELQTEREEYEFPDTLETKQDSYLQYFQPKHDYIESLQIRLALNHQELLETYNWGIQLCILDEMDDVICSTQVNKSEITNWGFLKWDVSKELDADKVYKLEIRQVEGKTENGVYLSSYVPFYSAVHIDEHVKFLHNNKQIDNEIEIIYTYQYENMGRYIWLLAVDIVIVLVMVFGYLYFRKDGILKAMLLLTPVFVMIVSELVAGNFFTIKIGYWITGVILNYFIYCLFIFFSKQVKWAATLYCALYVVIALVIYYVGKLRGRPFLLQDIISAPTAANVMKQYSYELDFMVGCSVLFLLLWMAIILMQDNMHLVGGNIKRKISVITIGVLCYFGFSGGVLSNIYGMSFDMWDVSGNYTAKGSTITLLSQIEYLTVKQPEGYSIKAVKECVESNTQEVLEYSADKTQPTNIVLIMNESWTDFNYIAPLETKPAITPFMDSLIENTEKGYLHMPVFGAGTANSEYEVLTGNSMEFLASGSTAYQLYATDTQWGMASSLKQQGYSAVALHPNSGANWNRNTVYPKMLFDDFISLENWRNDNPEFIRWCASDKEAYNGLMELYKDKRADEKLFSFLVTMQNHGGYNVEDFESTIQLNYENAYPNTEQYLTLINESDRAFQDLIEYFSTVTEPTMVVMFGDHLPDVEEEFYEELFGKELEDLTSKEKQKRYVTPYIIWTNYDCDMRQNVEMSANYFGSYILEKAGVSLTDYQKCNIQFRKKIPVIGVGGVYDANGNWYKMNDLPKTLEATLGEYKILQYNNVFGKKNRVDSVFTIKE